MNAVDLTVSDEINKKSSNSSSLVANKKETCSLKQSKHDEHDSFKNYKAALTSSAQFQATGKTMSMKQRNIKQPDPDQKKNLPPK